MLKKKVLEFINNPYDLKVNLDLGYLYEQCNQFASAISHYMRGAEYGLDSNDDNKDILISECLFRASEVFNKLGSRINSKKALVLHAISNTPELPQLYFSLSKIQEELGDWNECNTSCSIGLSLLDNHRVFIYDPKTYNSLENELRYQKIISDYHLGRLDKVKLDFEILKRKPDLDSWIDKAIDNSLQIVGKPVLYKQIGYNDILSSKEIFKDNKFISYSQCLQDIFVSSIVGLKGTYLEIGSGDPFLNNNTYLLERDYNWKGVSVDNDVSMVNKFNSSRVNKAIAADARNIDYDLLLTVSDLGKDIDYLQIDCEPPEVTLEVLYKIPFDKYKFSIITFEHDAYRSPSTRELSRKYLKEKGYELLISDISFNNKDSFEDWWVHSETIYKHINRKDLDKIRQTNKEVKNILDIFL